MSCLLSATSTLMRVLPIQRLNSFFQFCAGSPRVSRAANQEHEHQRTLTRVTGQTIMARLISPC